MCFTRPRAGHVGATAEVDEWTVRVDRDDLVVGQVGDPFELERVVGEPAPRLGAIDFFANEGVIRLHDLAHPRLDALEILRCERSGDIEIVVEPVFDRGTKPDLGVREQLPHRSRKHVGGGVPQHVQRLDVFLRENCHAASIRQGARQVPNVVVDANRERRLGEAGSDRSGQGGAGRPDRDRFLAPVR